MMNQRIEETTAALSGLVYVYNQSIDSLFFFSGRQLFILLESARIQQKEQTQHPADIYL